MQNCIVRENTNPANGGVIFNTEGSRMSILSNTTISGPVSPPPPADSRLTNLLSKYEPALIINEGTMYIEDSVQIISQHDMTGVLNRSELIHV